MELSGSAELPLAPAPAFERLLDPEVLRRCIPGCESMQALGDGRYAALLKVGVGAVKGSFKGEVTLSEVKPPESYRLSISGKSAVGYVHGGALMRLEAAGGGKTLIRYEGEAKVSGLIASVGGRLVLAVAKKMAARFFDALAEDLARTDSGGDPA